MTQQMYYKSAALEKNADGTYEFVASDESEDRYGDIIRVSGWDLRNYKRNPIVLFGHRHDTPVGIAPRVWVEETKLMAKIKLADEGTSPFIDTLRKLVDQKIIRAVSVGFRPTKDPNYLRDKEDHITGLEFIGQELLENSLVTVPANPAALATAKSMGLPGDHLARIFVAPRSPNASVHMGLQKAMMEMVALGVSSRSR